GFLAPRSYCSPICGDGELRRGEVCDDGHDNVDQQNASYGACVECVSREFCGDDLVTGPEACDNGLNISTYASDDEQGCAPGCQLPGVCGDGILQPGYEDCDLGEAGNTGGYGGCNPDCTWGPFCGDGVLD